MSGARKLGAAHRALYGISGLALFLVAWQVIGQNGWGGLAWPPLTGVFALPAVPHVAEDRNPVRHNRYDHRRIVRRAARLGRADRQRDAELPDRAAVERRRADRRNIAHAVPAADARRALLLFALCVNRFAPPA